MVVSYHLNWNAKLFIAENVAVGDNCTIGLIFNVYIIFYSIFYMVSMSPIVLFQTYVYSYFFRFCFFIYNFITRKLTSLVWFMTFRNTTTSTISTTNSFDDMNQVSRLFSGPGFHNLMRGRKYEKKHEDFLKIEKNVKHQKVAEKSFR